MVVAYTLRPRNRRKQRNNSPSKLQKRDRHYGDLFIFFALPLNRLTAMLVDMLTSPLQACAPVAQRIEHLPCWSLSEEEFVELIKWTAPYAGTPLEPPVLERE